ncbi:MAG: hypothetical protein MZW92_70070 [Comamonadaceae bacterium]|nr:hypothetical protein [Comamonadaceae bacterium]
MAKRIAEELNIAAGRGGRLQGALPGPAAARRLGQADDRRHPARRDAERPAAARLRHADHRRGARAQPQHRLPARLPAAAAAAAARPEGRRHLGHHRRRALRAALRVGDGPAPVIEVSGRLYPGRACAGGRSRTRTTTTTATLDGRASSTRWTNCGAAAGRGDILVFLPGEREIREAADHLRKHLAARARRPQPRSCRCSRACRQAEQDRVFEPGSGAAHRAGHQRRRDLAHGAGHPLRDRHRRWRASSATATATRSSSCRSSRSAQAAANQRAGPLRPRGRRRLHPPLRRGRLRRRGRASPTPRSCARRWPA